MALGWYAFAGATVRFNGQRFLVDTESSVDYDRLTSTITQTSTELVVTQSSPSAGGKLATQTVYFRKSGDLLAIKQIIENPGMAPLTRYSYGWKN
jgi:hypothetical protein